jgi:hypothetical protein
MPTTRLTIAGGVFASEHSLLYLRKREIFMVIGVVLGAVGAVAGVAGAKARKK